MEKFLPAKLDVSLPTYSKFDIIGNTLGRYFDYKREKEIIEYEKEKLKAQTDVALKKIDSEYSKYISTQEKDFKKEIKRLNSIEKELKSNRMNRKKILKQQSQIIKKLSKGNISKEEHIVMLNIIELMAKELENSYNNSNKVINEMTNFNNTKLLGE